MRSLKKRGGKHGPGRYQEVVRKGTVLERRQANYDNVIANLNGKAFHHNDSRNSFKRPGSKKK
mgnify:CR=1 FL=1